MMPSGEVIARLPAPLVGDGGRTARAPATRRRRTMHCRPARRPERPGDPVGRGHDPVAGCPRSPTATKSPSSGDHSTDDPVVVCRRRARRPGDAVRRGHDPVAGARPRHRARTARVPATRSTRASSLSAADGAERPVDPVRRGHHPVAGAACCHRAEQPELGDQTTRDPVVVRRRAARRPGDAVRRGHHPVAGAGVRDRARKARAPGDQATANQVLSAAEVRGVPDDAGRELHCARSRCAAATERQPPDRATRRAGQVLPAGARGPGDPVASTPGYRCRCLQHEQLVADDAQLLSPVREPVGGGDMSRRTTSNGRTPLCRFATLPARPCRPPARRGRSRRSGLTFRVRSLFASSPSSARLEKPDCSAIADVVRREPPC